MVGRPFLFLFCMNRLYLDIPDLYRSQSSSRTLIRRTESRSEVFIVRKFYQKAFCKVKVFGLKSAGRRGAQYPSLTDYARMAFVSVLREFA